MSRLEMAFVFLIAGGEAKIDTVLGAQHSNYFLRTSDANMGQ